MRGEFSADSSFNGDPFPRKVLYPGVSVAWSHDNLADPRRVIDSVSFMGAELQINHDVRLNSGALLSPREETCALLRALGTSAAETGRYLHLGEQSARANIARANKKLGYSRWLAISELFGSGVIEINKPIDEAEAPDDMRDTLLGLLIRCETPAEINAEIGYTKRGTEKLILRHAERLGLPNAYALVTWGFASGLLKPGFTKYQPGNLRRKHSSIYRLNGNVQREWLLDSSGGKKSGYLYSMADGSSSSLLYEGRNFWQAQLAEIRIGDGRIKIDNDANNARGEKRLNPREISALGIVGCNGVPDDFARMGVPNADNTLSGAYLKLDIGEGRWPLSVFRALKSCFNAGILVPVARPKVDLTAKEIALVNMATRSRSFRELGALAQLAPSTAHTYLRAVRNTEPPVKGRELVLLLGAAGLLEDVSYKK